jgi:hypothetical protein
LRRRRFLFGLLRLLRILFFLILFLILSFILRFLRGPARFGRSRWRRRCISSPRTASAFLKEEAEDVQQKQDTHAVKVREESLVIVQWQFVRHHFAYYISDAYDYEQLRIDEAHDDEERRSEIRSCIRRCSSHNNTKYDTNK